jgi:hypothetical protein
MPDNRSDMLRRSGPDAALGILARLPAARVARHRFAASIMPNPARVNRLAGRAEIALTAGARLANSHARTKGERACGKSS